MLTADNTFARLVQFDAQALIDVLRENALAGIGGKASPQLGQPADSGAIRPVLLGTRYLFPVTECFKRGDRVVVRVPGRDSFRGTVLETHSDGNYDIRRDRPPPAEEKRRFDRSVAHRRSSVHKEHPLEHIEHRTSGASVGQGSTHRTPSSSRGNEVTTPVHGSHGGRTPRSTRKQGASMWASGDVDVFALAEGSEGGSGASIGTNTPAGSPHRLHGSRKVSKLSRKQSLHRKGSKNAFAGKQEPRKPLSLA